MQRRTFITIFSTLIAVVFLFLGTFITLKLTSSTAAVSAVVKDDQGNVYANKTIRIGNQTVTTDDYGQFFTHIKTNRNYAVKQENVNFTIKVNKNGKLQTTGSLKENLELQTPNKTVKFTVRTGVAYFGKDSDYSYVGDKLTLSSHFQLRSGDKVVLEPTKKYRSGLALKVKSITSSNGKIQAITIPTTIQNVLTNLQIHTGQVTGSELTKIASKNTEDTDFKLEPTDLKISGKANLEISHNSFNKDFDNGKKSQIKLSGNLSGSTDISGKFQVDANYNFVNKNKDYIKAESSLAVTSKAAAKFTAEYGIKGKNGKMIEIASYQTPIPFVTIPVKLYLNAKAQFNTSLENTFNPTITVNANFKDGLQMKYNEATPQSTLSFDGSIKGDYGLVIGPDLTAYFAELFTVGTKVGFDGEADISGKYSTLGDNNFSGKGTMNFGVYLLAESPFLNSISGEKGTFSIEKNIFKSEIFSEKIESGQGDVKAANEAVEKAEKAKSDAESKTSKQQMDIRGVSSGDLSSIKGTWKNSIGETITVTSNTIEATDFLNGITITANGTRSNNGDSPGAGGFGTSDSAGFKIGSGKNYDSGSEIINGSLLVPTNGSISTPKLFLIPAGIDFSKVIPTGEQFVENSEKNKIITTQGDVSNKSKDRMVFALTGIATVGTVPTEITNDSFVYYKVMDEFNSTSTYNQSMIDSDVKKAQEAVNKLSQEWEKASKNSLQARLDKVEGKDIE
ncbi:DUF6287 domain-containing protein [Lactococcus lactis]